MISVKEDKMDYNEVFLKLKRLPQLLFSDKLTFHILIVRLSYPSLSTGLLNINFNNLLKRECGR